MHGSHRRETLCSSWSASLRVNIHVDTTPGTKEPTPQHNNRATCRKQCYTNTCYLITHTSPCAPCTLAGLSYSVKLASVPVWGELPPEDQHKTVPTGLPPRVLQSLSSSSKLLLQVSFHKQIKYTELKHHIQAKEKTLPTVGRETLFRHWPERASKTQQQSAHSTYQRHSMKCKALDTDLFFIKPLFSEAGDIIGFSNMEKNAET